MASTRRSSGSKQKQTKNAASPAPRKKPTRKQQQPLPDNYTPISKYRNKFDKDGDDYVPLSARTDLTGFRTDKWKDSGRIVEGENGWIEAQTPMQLEIIKAIRENQITFISGLAGTGKTFLAVAMGFAGLVDKEYDLLQLIRPPVEAGQSVGFLPGDLGEKYAPFLMPFIDNMQKICGKKTTDNLIATDRLKLSALGHIRGSTIDGFAIIDEAQNCTKGDMELLLTRLGANGKLVITGDPTQTDLKKGTSGFSHAIKLLGGKEGVGTVYLTEADCQRSGLVKEAILAYKADRDYTQQERLKVNKKKGEAA